MHPVDNVDTLHQAFFRPLLRKLHSQTKKAVSVQPLGGYFNHFYICTFFYFLFFCSDVYISEMCGMVVLFSYQAFSDSTQLRVAACGNMSGPNYDNHIFMNILFFCCGFF